MAFRVATYNAGLAVGLLPHATERAERVVQALAALDVDLLFVQEFWLDAHWLSLCRALHDHLPHALRPQPLLGRSSGACSARDVEPLVACAEKHCAGLTDEALARCVVSHCAATALVLPTPCLNCIASHPVGTLVDIVSRCLGEATSSESAGKTRAAGYGGLMAYGGSFGTGLLSKLPLLETDSVVFESTVNARGALHAVVAEPELGRLRIFAAHLSPGGAEHGVQVERLLDYVGTKPRSEPALLLGDLNTTPGSSAFAKFLRAGFAESDPADRRGTYTSDGLGGGRSLETSFRLDHVLVRSNDVELRTERILDQPVTLEAGARRVQTTLSDHFGVLATLERSRRR